MAAVEEASPPADPLTFSPHHYWLRDQGPVEADPELEHAEAAPRSAPRRKSAAPARAAPVEEEEEEAPADPLTFSPHHYWLRDQGPAEADPELEQVAAAAPRSAPRRKSAAPAPRAAAVEEIEEAEAAPPADPLAPARSPHHIWLRDQGPVEADPELAGGGARGGGAASAGRFRRTWAAGGWRRC